jgi:hypothetical protein
LSRFELALRPARKSFGFSASYADEMPGSAGSDLQTDTFFVYSFRKGFGRVGLPAPRNFSSIVRVDHTR